MSYRMDYSPKKADYALFIILKFYFCPPKESDMKDSSIFKQLDMAMLPIMEHTLIFENEFMLADNFGLLPEPQAASEFVATSYPFKINFTLILLCADGYLRVRINLQEYLLQAGSILVILPNTIGQCLEVSENCQLALIAYSGNKYGTDINTTASLSVLKYLSKRAILHLSPEELEETFSIYNAMRRKVEQTDYQFTREALNGYMQVLRCNGFQWIARYNKSFLETKTESRQEKLFNRFLELAQKYYKEERSVTFYADKMCLTPKYLSLVVRQVSGRYAGEWIKDFIILEAKALLKSKVYTVQQVSDMLNFSNPSFFGKYFKGAVGQSPRQYMRN